MQTSWINLHLEIILAYFNVSRKNLDTRYKGYQTSVIFITNEFEQNQANLVGYVWAEKNISNEDNA